MWRSRMFWRLFGTYSLLLLSAIGLLGAVVASRVASYQERQVNEQLRTRVRLVQEVVRDWPAERRHLLEDRVLHLGQDIGTRITLLDSEGRVLADSGEDPERMENHLDRPEIQSAKANGDGSATRFSTTLGRTMKYQAIRMPTGSGVVSYVRVALPLEDIQEKAAAFAHVIWKIAAVTGLVALLLAFWQARQITKPLQELTKGTERLATGEYGHKVYLSARDEVGVLAETFNTMSERLAGQFAQLQEEGNQLRTILGSMVEGVVALDVGQRILFANERAAQLLGFQLQSAVGRRFWEVVRQRAFQDLFRRALDGLDPCHENISWDGGGIKSLTVQAARLPGTPVRGVVLVIHDTTELRRLERLRQDFVANVSHELKTPLSVIKACVETLQDGAVNDPQHRDSFLDQIATQAERLHALILDLLSLARVESGAEVFEFEQVPLEPLVQRCLERHRARAEAKNQVLEAIEGTESGVATWADEDALNNILENLVDNALKYTQAGGSIRVRWWNDDGQVHLEVADTGIGIPEQDLPRIFERFYRVDKARSRELGGTGLGLSIVKHLVQSMHGQIQATSRVGQGTVFHVQLPRATAS